ncbi:hypothetical protein GCM10023088_66050 [Actinomadura verrucosospora]
MNDPVLTARAGEAVRATVAVAAAATAAEAIAAVFVVRDKGGPHFERWASRLHPKGWGGRSVDSCAAPPMAGGEAAANRGPGRGTALSPSTRVPTGVERVLTETIDKGGWVVNTWTTLCHYLKMTLFIKCRRACP